MIDGREHAGQYKHGARERLEHAKEANKFVRKRAHVYRCLIIVRVEWGSVV
jgi:hypothetical protein